MADNMQAPWTDFELPIADPTAVMHTFTQEQLITMVRAVARKRSSDAELATLFDVEQMVRAQFSRYAAQAVFSRRIYQEGDKQPGSPRSM